MTDVTITTKLKGLVDLEKGLGRVDKQVDKLGKSFQKFGGQMKAAGQTLATRVTLPILGLGTAMLKTAADFEQGMNRVQALTNATSDDFKRMERVARDLGATTQFSATQAADAMGFMAQAGLEVDEIVGGLPTALKLASAAQIDMGRAADVVTNIMSGFGKGVEELEATTSVLVATFINTNTDLNQLAEGMKQAGPIAKGFGSTIEETAAVLGLMADAGFQGSLGGTSLRNALIKLGKPANDAKEAMRDMGINVKDASGQLLDITEIFRQFAPHVDRTTDLITIFGMRGGPAMAAALGKGFPAFEELLSKLQNTGNILDRVSRVQMKGLTGAWREMRSAFDEVSISFVKSGIGEAMENLFRNIATGLRDLAKLNTQTKQLAILFAGVAAALGPLLIVLGSVTAAFGFLLTKITFFLKLAMLPLILAFKGLLLLLSPIALKFTLLIGLFTAAAGVIASLIVQWDEWERIGLAAIDQVASTYSKWLVLFKNGLLIITKKANSVIPVFDTLIEKLRVDLAGAVDEWVIANDRAADSARDAGDAFDTIVQENIDGVEELIASAQLLGESLMNDVGDRGSAAVQSIINKLEEMGLLSSSVTADATIAFEGMEASVQNAAEQTEDLGNKTVDTGVKTIGVFGAAGLAIDEYIKKVSDRATRFQALWATAIGSFEDMLTEAILTGDINFKSFIDSMKRALAKFVAQELTMFALAIAKSVAMEVGSSFGLDLAKFGLGVAGNATGASATGGAGGGLNLIGSIGSKLFGLGGGAGGAAAGAVGGTLPGNLMAGGLSGAAPAAALAAAPLAIFGGFAAAAFGLQAMGKKKAAAGERRYRNVLTAQLEGSEGIGKLAQLYGAGAEDQDVVGGVTMLNTIRKLSLSSRAFGRGMDLVTELFNQAGIPRGDFSAREQIARQANNAIVRAHGGVHGGDRIPALAGTKLGDIIQQKRSKLADMIGDGFALGTTNRVVSTPTLFMAGEGGPEILNVDPLANGGGRGRTGVQVLVEGPAVFDDLTADDFAQRIQRGIEDRERRGII